MNTCRDCRWWKALPNGKEGECRRHSPSALTSVKFPRTLYSDWCGEHSTAEETPRKERDAILQDVANTLQKILSFIERSWERGVIVEERSVEIDHSAEANYE